MNAVEPLSLLTCQMNTPELALTPKSIIKKDKKKERKFSKLLGY